MFHSGQLFQFRIHIILVLDSLMHKDTEFIDNVLLKQIYLKH